MHEDKIKDCHCCGNNYLAIRKDIYKDGREFVYCDSCGAMATKDVWQMINKFADEEANKSPIEKISQCEKHHGPMPCSRCWEEAQETKKVFRQFNFKPCVCFSDTQKNYCIDKNKCSKIVAQDQKR